MRFLPALGNTPRAQDIISEKSCNGLEDAFTQQPDKDNSIISSAFWAALRQFRGTEVNKENKGIIFVSLRLFCGLASEERHS
jgi:hypothetical protein